MMTDWGKYIIFFAQEHVEFRYPELESLLKLNDIPCKFLRDSEDPQELLKPFCIVELPNADAARLLASRSVSIKCILELWSTGSTYAAFHDNLRSYLEQHKSSDEFSKIFHKDTSFKVTVESYNKHFTQKEKVEKIETLGYLPVEGEANLRTPDVQWYYIEFYGFGTNDAPEEPFDILFGKWVADGCRSLIKDICLKNRKFIGNTSMDPTLSLLMANQGLAKSGALVMDTFVGSGSLLVAAAKFGAYVVGTDIDYLMLHGRSKPTRVSQKIREIDESVLANLKQYNCADRYLDVLVSDFSLPIWRSSLQLDSIITDPPYGIRETHEKIESKNRRPLKQPQPVEGAMHYPSKSPYALSNLFQDLLNFAARHLRLGGRLVFWIPVIKGDYSENTLPVHSCLRLISNAEQTISALTSRRLLTYEKLTEAQSEEELHTKAPFETFRTKFFTYGDENRQQARLRKAEIRENGRKEALKRGKVLNEDGKVVNNSDFDQTT